MRHCDHFQIGDLWPAPAPAPAPPRVQAGLNYSSTDSGAPFRDHKQPTNGRKRGDAIGHHYLEAEAIAGFGDDADTLQSGASAS